MIGDRIRQLRREARMTQKDLAERMGISASAVGMYEQNRREPSGEVLVKLCRIFNVTTDWLLSGSADVPRVRSGMQADVAGMLEQWKEALMDQEGLMFNGQLLEEGDLEKIFAAMKLGAEIAASQNIGRKKGEDETSERRSGKAGSDLSD